MVVLPDIHTTIDLLNLDRNTVAATCHIAAEGNPFTHLDHTIAQGELSHIDINHKLAEELPLAPVNLQPLPSSWGQNLWLQCSCQLQSHWSLPGWGNHSLLN